MGFSFSCGLQLILLGYPVLFYFTFIFPSQLLTLLTRSSQSLTPGAGATVTPKPGVIRPQGPPLPRLIPQDSGLREAVPGLSVTTKNVPGHCQRPLGADGPRVRDSPAADPALAFPQSSNLPTHDTLRGLVVLVRHPFPCSPVRVGGSLVFHRRVPHMGDGAGHTAGTQ